MHFLLNSGQGPDLFFDRKKRPLKMGDKKVDGKYVPPFKRRLEANKFRKPRAPYSGELKLLATEKKAETFGKREVAAGIMPVCIDRETKVVYALLSVEYARLKEEDPPYIDAQGRQHRRIVLGTFHGWVEPGETTKQGAAREAAEEGRGVFGGHLALFRCLLQTAFHRQLIEERLYVVSLGLMCAQERSDLCDHFRGVVGQTACENELIGIHFVKLRELREACLQEPPSRSARLGSSIWPVAGFPPEIWLRRFLQHWLTTERSVDDFEYGWHSQWINILLSETEESTHVMRIIGELPPLNVSELREYEAFLCVDRTLQCRSRVLHDFPHSFVHSAANQLYFRQRNWPDPQRCPACRNITNKKRQHIPKKFAHLFFTQTLRLL